MVFDPEGLLYQVEPYLARVSGYLEDSKEYLEKINIPGGLTKGSYIVEARTRLEEEKKNIDNIKAWLVGKIDEITGIESENSKFLGKFNIGEQFLRFGEGLVDAAVIFGTLFNASFVGPAAYLVELVGGDGSFYDEMLESSMAFVSTSWTTKWVGKAEDGILTTAASVTAKNATKFLFGPSGTLNSWVWGVSGFGTGAENTWAKISENNPEMSTQAKFWLGIGGGILNGAKEVVSEVLSTKWVDKIFGNKVVGNVLDDVADAAKDAAPKVIDGVTDATTKAVSKAVDEAVSQASKEAMENVATVAGKDLLKSFVKGDIKDTLKTLADPFIALVSGDTPEIWKVFNGSVTPTQYGADCADTATGFLGKNTYNSFLGNLIKPAANKASQLIASFVNNAVTSFIK